MPQQAMRSSYGGGSMPTEEELAQLEADLAAQEAVPPPTQTAQPMQQSAPPPAAAPPPPVENYGMGVPASDPAVVYAQQQAPPPPPSPSAALHADEAVPPPQAAADPTYQATGFVVNPAFDPVADAWRQSASRPYSSDASIPPPAPQSTRDAAAAYGGVNQGSGIPYEQGRRNQDVGREQNQRRIFNFQRENAPVPPPALPPSRPIRDNPPGPLGGTDAAIFSEAWRPEVLGDAMFAGASPEQQAAEVAAGTAGGLGQGWDRFTRGFMSGGTPSPITVSEVNASNAARGDIVPRDSGLTAIFNQARGQLEQETSDAEREHNRQVVGQAVSGLGDVVQSAIQRQDQLRGPAAALRGEPTTIPAPPPSDLTVGRGYAGVPSNVSDRLLRDAQTVSHTPADPNGGVGDARGLGPAPTSSGPGNPFDWLGEQVRKVVPEGVAAPSLPTPMPSPTPGANPVIAQPSARSTPVPSPTTGEKAGERTLQQDVNGTKVDVIWNGDTPVAVVDPESGERISIDLNTMTQEQVDAIFADVTARTPTGVSSPATPSTNTSVAAPATGTTNTRSSGGKEWVDYGTSGGGNGGDYRRSSGSSGARSNFDDFMEERDREFTAEDFMDEAGGDRKKAASLARAANRKRRMKKGKSSTSTMGKKFPFNRPPSPTREFVLTAIRDSVNKGR